MGSAPRREHARRTPRRGVTTSHGQTRDDGRVLTIREFSRLTRLGVRTLRRYQEAGLLEPTAVDGATGYRSYDPEQIPAAQLAHRLCELGVPLPEVQQVLLCDDPTLRAALVADHVRHEVDGNGAAVTSLRRLLEPEPAPVDAELRAVPERAVAAVEGHVRLDDVLAWYADATAELDAAVTTPAGAPGAMFDNALFEDGRGRALVYVPTEDAASGGRVRATTLPAVELAVTTHVGGHEDVDVTYGRLGAWVVANELAVAGPARETYLVGPRDTSERSAWRAEIGWPVFPVTS